MSKICEDSLWKIEWYDHSFDSDFKPLYRVVASWLYSCLPLLSVSCQLIEFHSNFSSCACPTVNEDKRFKSNPWPTWEFLSTGGSSGRSGEKGAMDSPKSEQKIVYNVSIGEILKINFLKETKPYNLTACRTKSHSRALSHRKHLLTRRPLRVSLNRQWVLSN